jgi:aspartate aminotransferase
MEMEDVIRYSSRSQTLRPSATLQITAMAKALKAEGRDIVSMSAGQPDFPTPVAAILAAEKAMRDGNTGYTASTGMPELKDAVAKAYSERRGVDYSIARTMISCGAKHSITNLLLAAVNTGDRILIPRPYWVSYPEMVKLCGGIPVLPEGEGMPLSASDIERAAAEGAVGMILNSPSNPSGMVYDREEIGDISEVLAENDMWVISDDIYEDLVYLDSSAPHVLDVRPDLADRVAVVSGVSKTYSMTGWRIGFALANEEWIRRAGIIQAHSTSNPCTISQYAALAMVRGEGELERRSMLGAFRIRRDLICDLLLAEERLQVVVPHGAFYVFPALLYDTEVDTAVFCQLLLEKEGLATIPGSAFGAEGHVRLSFAASEDDIREGVKRLRSFMSRESFR